VSKRYLVNTEKCLPHSSCSKIAQIQGAEERARELFIPFEYSNDYERMMRIIERNARLILLQDKWLGD